MTGLRIVHAIDTLDPAAGGPPVVAIRLAAAQAALGCSASILAYWDDHAAQRAQALIDETPGGDRVAIHRVPKAGRLERLTGRAAAATFRRLAEQQGADVLHTHGMWEPMLPACAAAARRLGVPYVVTPHGMLDPYTLSVKRNKKRLALATTHRRFLRQASFVHVLNDDEATLAEPVLAGTPTRVIPNGIFLEEMERAPEPGSFYERFPELAGKPYVLFLSRLAHKKGLDVLAEAFAIVHREMPSVRLVVAGPDDGQRADFERRVDRAGLRSCVHLVGPLYGTDKLAALRDAAVFCLPSRQEGFSIAITEALAMALPVVVTRACHYPQVTEVGAGIETELDADEVARALITVLGDPQAARAMGQAGARLVRERFTWPSVARRTIECYNQAKSGS
ncbi:MAG: glycosyl transferase [Phycisphaerales bacterium]|nr:MAG: glycosyl transferase [Phycisphaerales bacterium]